MPARGLASDLRAFARSGAGRRTLTLRQAMSALSSSSVTICTQRASGGAAVASSAPSAAGGGASSMKSIESSAVAGSFARSSQYLPSAATAQPAQQTALLLDIASHMSARALSQPRESRAQSRETALLCLRLPVTRARKTQASREKAREEKRKDAGVESRTGCAVGRSPERGCGPAAPPAACRNPPSSSCQHPRQAISETHGRPEFHYQLTPAEAGTCNAVRSLSFSMGALRTAGRAPSAAPSAGACAPSSRSRSPRAAAARSSPAHHRCQSINLASPVNSTNGGQ